MRGSKVTANICFLFPSSPTSPLHVNAFHVADIFVMLLAITGIYQFYIKKACEGTQILLILDVRP